MLRKFIGNFSLLFFLNILIKPLWIFGIDMGVQNQVGSDYGLYAALFNFAFLLAILLDLGMTNYVNRTIAQSSRLAQKYLARLLSFKVVLGVVYFVVIYLLSKAVGYSGRPVKLLMLLCVNQFLMSLVLFLRSFLQALMLFKWDAVVSIMDRTIMILLCGAVLHTSLTGTEMTIGYFIVFQTVAYILVTLLLMIVLGFKLNWRAISFDWKFSLLVIQKSLPYASLILLMSFYYRLDAFMVERLATDGVVQAGIYAKGFRILDALSMLAYLSSTLLLPMFARQLVMGQRVQPLAKTALGILVPGGVVISAVALFYSVEMMDIFYHSEVSQAAIIWQILMPCMVPMCLSYVFGTLLTSDGQMGALNKMALVTAVMNLGLNFWFIKQMDAKGAAIASFITQWVAAIWQLALVKRTYGLDEITQQLVKIGAFLILVLGCFYAASHYIDNWMAGVGAALGASLLLFFVFQFVKLSELKQEPATGP